MHDSFVTFALHRSPIVKWLRDQSTESMGHATQAAEHVAILGGHPSLRIGELLETNEHGVDEILAESCSRWWPSRTRCSRKTRAA